MKILSVGTALPDRRLSNDELLAEILESSRPYLASRDVARLESRLRRTLRSMGAAYRHIRGPGERAADFGVEAGCRALREAALTPADIDLLIYVGVGKGLIEPASANLFQDALNLRAATCFDISDACAAWLRGVDVANHLLRSGQYRRAMILNCEFNLREYGGLCVRSLDDLPLVEAGVSIGEAATATIVSGGEDPQGDFYASFRNGGEDASLCMIPLPHAGQFAPRGLREQPPLQFRVNARALHRSVVRRLVDHYRSDERIHTFAPDLVLGHAVSVRSAKIALSHMKIPYALYLDLFPRYGNTVSASVPLALASALGTGRARPGTRALFVVGSAGVTTGLATYTF